MIWVKTSIIVQPDSSPLATLGISTQCRVNQGGRGKGATTLSIMTLSIMLFSIMAGYCYNKCRKVGLYAECYYADCPYAECRYAECSECYYAECCGAQGK